MRLVDGREALGAHLVGAQAGLAQLGQVALQRRERDHDVVGGVGQEVAQRSLALLGALPGTREISEGEATDGPGATWFALLLPVVGFLVLWRQADAWTTTPLVRELATLVLGVSATLAVLRAHARRGWRGSLRGLLVLDVTLGAMLVALDAVPRDLALVLTLAAATGRLAALAIERHGASSRRSVTLVRLWRLSGWLSGVCLAWPVLLAVGFPFGRLRLVPLVLLALPLHLAATMAVRRVLPVPERRVGARHDLERVLGAIVAGAVLIAGPLVLTLAWWRGALDGFPEGYAIVDLYDDGSHTCNYVAYGWLAG